MRDENGLCVHLQEIDDGLKITLTDYGRDELKASLVNDGEFGKPTDDLLRELLEDHLENDWEMVPPEDIGALTDAPILSQEIERDDQGVVTKAGVVYWFPNYAVTCPVLTLLETGEVFFSKEI